jgi:hypothetical protein
LFHMQPWGVSCHRGQGHKLLVLWSPWYDRLLPPPSNTMREGLLPKYLWTSAFVFRQLLLKIIASYPLDIIQTKQTNDLWAWLHLFSSFRSFCTGPSVQATGAHHIHYTKTSESPICVQNNSLLPFFQFNPTFLGKQVTPI